MIVRRFVVLLLLMVLTQPAAAADWSRQDIALEAGYLVFHTIDWMQTRQISRNPEKYWEFNPVLGKHPSGDTVNLFFISTMAAHLLISNALPPDWRTFFQSSTMVIELGLSIHNYNIGLRSSF